MIVIFLLSKTKNLIQVLETFPVPSAPNSYKEIPDLENYPPLNYDSKIMTPIGFK